jgi:Fe-S oxidoreductase
MLNYRFQQTVYYWAENKESQLMNISVFFEVQIFCCGGGGGYGIVDRGVKSWLRLYQFKEFGSGSSY